MTERFRIRELKCTSCTAPLVYPWEAPDGVNIEGSVISGSIVTGVDFVGRNRVVIRNNRSWEQ